MSISIKNLSFKYKHQESGRAIENINLEIPEGQFVVIMGPSGAGKSTIANCLNGLIPHFIRGDYEGEVVVNDLNAKKEKVSSMAKNIGLVFQDFESQLFSTNTKLEIAFGPENFGVPRDEIEKRINETLKVVDLEEFASRQPATLSGGQKQRLAIASVLSTSPKIICMDEPTTDLDPVGKIGVFNIAKELHKNGELTLIIIEHESEEALYADRIVLVKDGKIIKDGLPTEVLKEVKLMDEIGIMSLQIPKFFSNFSNLEKEKLPLTVEEGVDKFNDLNLKINDEKYESLLENDRKREENYGETVIEAKNLTHIYPNGKKAVDDVSVDIREGEFIAFLGHNGSGKTTFVKHINGLLNPTSGNIKVNGVDTLTSNIFEIGKNVGYVFQNPDHQIFADTVYDEIAFSPKIRGLSKEEVDERVKESLEAVELQGYEKEDPFTLTKGERQRIAVASVLAARPKVIILDEPTTGLDYKEQKQMMELIKKLNEKGHTIIMITHTMWVVAEYAHKVAVIKQGKLAMYGNVREVFSREKELKELYLKTPQIVALSNRLGKTILSVDEMLNAVEVK